MRKYLAILLLFLSVCFSCQAHMAPRHHRHPRRHHPAVLAIAPAKTVTGNTIIARMNMAIAYLDKNKRMEVATYSRMTGLPKASAEAELDSFAVDRNIPIGIALSGKKKVYVLTS